MGTENNISSKREQYLASRRKYNEEHKEERRAYDKKYREEHREKRRAYDREYNKNHKEERQKWYEENKERNKERRKVWYNANKEKLKRKKTEKKQSKYRRYNSDLEREMYQRADHLARNYRRIDTKKGFDIHDAVDGNWIYDNILTKSCVYCGNSNWKELGCDRKINTEGHTPENCVPCCKNCNDKKNSRSYDEYIKTLKPAGDYEGTPVQL